MGKPQASQGAVNSVQAPQGGLFGATSTTAISFDLRAWAGRYVKLTVEDQPHFYLAASATGGSLAPTPADALNAASPNAAIPDYLAAGGTVHFLVDAAFPFLRVATTTGTGKARVFRS
jgi:hypothetical protein